MKNLLLLLLAGPTVLSAAALLSGCATDPKAQGDSLADASYTPVGTYIPRKKSAGPGAGNVANASLQSLENDRMNGNGTINLPTK